MKIKHFIFVFSSFLLFSSMPQFATAQSTSLQKKLTAGPWYCIQESPKEAKTRFIPTDSGYQSYFSIQFKSDKKAVSTVPKYNGNWELKGTTMLKMTASINSIKTDFIIEDVNNDAFLVMKSGDVTYYFVRLIVKNQLY